MDSQQLSSEKLQWSALEYEDKERSKDWFWALGVIIFTSCATAIIFANYFFAALIVLGGTLLGVFATRKPKTVSYELTEKGLRAGTRLFPYDSIHSFFVQTEIKPMLFIKSERIYLPILSIPIENYMAEDIRDVFLFKNIPEEEMREHISDKIMDYFGF